MYTQEEALQHYGIKGMRWGVRRSPDQLARARKGGKFKDTPKNMQSKDAAVVKKATDKIQKKKKKPDDVSALSNDELQDVILRLTLETQYNKLQNPQNAQKKSEGQKQAERMLTDMATKAAAELTKRAATELLKKVG